MSVELLISSLSIPISASTVFILSYLYLFRNRLKTVKGRKTYKILMFLYVISNLSISTMFAVTIVMSSSSVESSSPPPDTSSILFSMLQDVLAGSALGFFVSSLIFAVIKAYEKFFAKKIVFGLLLYFLFSLFYHG